MLYDLRHADTRIKWLVTCLLATLGLSYVFGALMVSLYAGFTPRSVAATYRGREMSMPMPPETTMVLEHPMSVAGFAKPEIHTVDTNLLIQDTHVHVGVLDEQVGVDCVNLRLGEPGNGHRMLQDHGGLGWHRHRHFPAAVGGRHTPRCESRVEGDHERAEHVGEAERGEQAGHEPLDPGVRVPQVVQHESLRLED